MQSNIFKHPQASDFLRISKFLTPLAPCLPLGHNHWVTPAASDSRGTPGSPRPSPSPARRARRAVGSLRPPPCRRACARGTPGPVFKAQKKECSRGPPQKWKNALFSLSFSLLFFPTSSGGYLSSPELLRKQDNYSNKFSKSPRNAEQHAIWGSLQKNPQPPPSSTWPSEAEATNLGFNSLSKVGHLHGSWMAPPQEPRAHHVPGLRPRWTGD